MDLDHAQTIVALVRTGSITAAAERLGVARPTIRRRLEALEAALGVTLVVSDLGSVMPTEAGKLYVDRAERLIRERDELHEAVRNLAEEPRGMLDIALPSGIGVDSGAHFLGLVLRAYPSMIFRVRSVVEPVRELERGAHGALTWELPSGGDFMVKVLGSVQWTLFASAQYLERHGSPAAVADLSGHTLLMWSELQQPAAALPLRTGALVSVSPRFHCSNFQILRDSIRQGHGIGMIPTFLAQDLVPVLPDDVGSVKSIWWVTTKASAADVRMQLIFPEVAKVFAGMLGTAGA
jgi:DNA-binding transcriptional LysR family regulator